MTATEFNAARTTLSLSDEQIAADFGVTPHVARAWAEGRVAVPKRVAEVLAFHAALVERETALRASGLGDCPWQQKRPDLAGLDAASIEREANLFRAHVATCELCKARERFVAEHFGAMPPMPEPGWFRIFAWIARVPSWARPAAVGAALIAGLMVIRLLLMAPSLFRNPERLGPVLVAILAAAAAGSVGGFAYSLTRPTLRKLGLIGAYLTGIVCMFAYMGAFVVVSPVAFGETIVESRQQLVVFGVVALVFGIFIGHSWFREPEIT